MVEILKMLGDFLNTKTNLPYDIQPTVASIPEPHITIIPDNLDIQVLKKLNTEDTRSLQLIGITLTISLTSSGASLEWLETVFDASLMINTLFSDYFNVCLGETQMGFSVAVEKNKLGAFVPGRENSYPFTYTEGWKAQITFKRGGITYGQKKT